MATDFPTSLQDLDATRGSSGDRLNSPDHPTHHALEDDTVEALQAKVGADSSAIATSHDYKLGNVTGTDKAVSLTGTETLTNKTLTSPKINLGSDASQDLYKRKADGTYERIPIGNANELLGVNGAGDTVEYLAISGVTTDEKAALAGTSGTPSTTNKFVTAEDVTEAKTASKIPRRDSNSDVLVATTPTAGDAAASKTYVDTLTDLTFSVVVSDLLKVSADTIRTSTSDTYEKLKEIEINYTGDIRVKFEIAATAAAGTAFGRIYINGIAVGTEREPDEQNGNYTIFSEDVNITNGDLVQIYAKRTTDETAYIKNFRIYYTVHIEKTANAPVVNTN